MGKKEWENGEWGMDEWGMGNILNEESLKADLRDFCLEKNIPYK